MRNMDYYNKHRWRLTHGYSETDNYLMEELVDTEWSKEFEQLMRNRLIMGSFRYGRLGDKNKPNYDRVFSILNRLIAYYYHSNKEHLVDIANLCMCEFVEGYGHFESIDDGEHVKIIK